MPRQRKSRSGQESEAPEAQTTTHFQRKLPFRGRPADDRLKEEIDAALEERFDRPVQP